MRIMYQYTFHCFKVHSHEILKLLQMRGPASVQNQRKSLLQRRFQLPFSDGNRADNDSILQQNADHQEKEVQEKHSESQHLIHPPVTDCNGDYDEEQHDEEQHNGTEESIAANSHWTKTMDGRVQQPGDWKTFE